MKVNVRLLLLYIIPNLPCDCLTLAFLIFIQVFLKLRLSTTRTQNTTSVRVFPQSQRASNRPILIYYVKPQCGQSRQTNLQNMDWTSKTWTQPAICKTMDSASDL